jgi:integral membrane protein
MLVFFKKIAFWEGISLLLLMGIAMPLKYVFDLPLMVKWVGWAHGILFVAYIFGMLANARSQKWSFIDLFWITLASFVPFGTFVMERKYL